MEKQEAKESKVTEVFRAVVGGREVKAWISDDVVFVENAPVVEVSHRLGVINSSGKTKEDFISCRVEQHIPDCSVDVEVRSKNFKPLFGSLNWPSITVTSDSESDDFIPKVIMRGGSVREQKEFILVPASRAV